MRLGVYQFTPEVGAMSANLDRIEAGLRGAAADLVVLPELCTTGYQLTPAEAEAWAEPVPDGLTTARLASLAAHEGIALCAGLAERGSDGRCYNASVLVEPEGRVAVYRKTHLFQDERDLFAPGDTGFFVREVRGVRVGLMICFDWVFPESARCLALQGADVLLHCANLVLPWCQRSMPVRCLENGVFAATANRCGTEDRIPGRPGLTFTGGSQITGPRGEILAAAGPTGDGLTVVEIDPARARDKWLNPRNHLLGDRRPEYYGTLARAGASQYEANATAGPRTPGGTGS